MHARSLRPWLVGLALLCAAPLAAQPAPPAAKRAPPPATDPVIVHEKYVLPNGLEVILAPDSTVPLVAVNVWYHVGSGYEVPGKTGFAHLFEHMLFQGSKNVGEDRHFDVLKNIGAGEVNGTTNPDRTNYYELVPSNQLETALWLESDRMSHLLELLTQKSLDNQIEVVRNERRQRYDNVPYGKARFALYEAMYPEGHPYRYLTIGRHEDLAGASLDDVKNFWKTWYVPANATLAIVGDFDPAKVKPVVAKWFGSLPPSTKPAVVAVPAPTPRAERREVTDSFAKLRQITWAFQAPANFGAGDAELDILANALGDRGTGRLYKILVHERQLAQSVSVYQNGSQFSGMFVVSVTAQSGADLSEIERVVRAELARVAVDPLTEREVRRAVTGFEATVVWGLEGLMARANVLQSFNHYLGAPDRLTWSLDRYRQATPDAIRTVAARVLDLERAVVIVTTPGGGK
ncbi:MAG: insulinase family protein [Myxococcales bacterium]|nr:insulinase family protein [Myxococcales bacterium]